MKKIKMLNGMIAITKASGISKKAQGAFVIPEVQDNLGLVEFVADALPVKVKPGDKVYYGPKVEPIRMDGKDVLVMDYENVFAVVVEE